MTNRAPNEFFKAFSDFKTPTFDFDSLFAAQRRNLEAFTEANQVVAEGVQALVRRNAEALRSGVESSIKASKEVFTGTSPEAATAKQADYAKNAFESALSHLREVAETVTKFGYEAADVLGKRVTESFEEIGKAPKATAKKK